MAADTRTRGAKTDRGTSGNGARPSQPPPHNLDAERALLGAALLSPTASGTTAGVPAAAYYSDNHGHIAAAITALHLDGKPIDPVTVADHLGPQLLDKIGGGRELVTLQTNCPAAASAPHYAQIVLDEWALRRTINHGTELANAAWQRDLDGVERWRNELTDLHTVAATSTWTEVDLAAVVLGDEPKIVPTILHRDDGQPLIYPGKVHAFNAESESGKSWLALAACAEQLAHREHVTYVDFEDSAEGIVERLELLGTPPGLLYGPDRLFHYVRPDDPIDTLAVAQLARIAATLVILDGVTEAMTLNGWSIKENDDIAAFLAQLPRMFARAGSAVILIDHVVKNKADRGDDALGGQHKRAGIDGASYKLEVVRPFGRGMTGAARLTVTKDRPGHIRPACVAGRTAGELRVISSASSVRAIVAAPSSIIDPDSAFRPTVLMERISRAVEDTGGETAFTTNDILKTVKGDRTAKQTAIRILVTEGFLTVTPGPNKSKLHTSARPYREADDTTSPITQRDERDPYEPF